MAISVPYAPAQEGGGNCKGSGLSDRNQAIRQRWTKPPEAEGGLRVAYQVLPPLSFTFFAMGPGTEFRGGILFQPEEKK